MTLGSAVQVIWLQPPKFVMGHMTWPRPYQGRFVLRRLLGCDLHIQPVGYIKFEVFATTNYEDA